MTHKEQKENNATIIIIIWDVFCLYNCDTAHFVGSRLLASLTVKDKDSVRQFCRVSDIKINIQELIKFKKVNTVY